MSQNRCDRCGRPIKDPNAKYGWRCAEIIAAGGSLTIDLSAILAMLEKYADFSFESQNDLFDISEIFEKMLTLSSAPYSMQTENDYVEKGASLAFAMFSNYDELGDKARKSAVSHFIEEMQRAEETLLPPSLRYTLAEQMNNKLIDYYEEENNPNTNDTVEDTIDELFGSIPLYHYLNAMFARTEAEFDDSLIKGLEGSFNAFMSLPYASSMMGDIAVIGPQMAFVPEPYVSQPEGTGKKSVMSNKGNVYDITPSKNHCITIKNPGLKGEPNSSVDILDDAGNIKTRRWFGENGDQIRDVDMTNHGNPKTHPEWPHEHGSR